MLKPTMTPGEVEALNQQQYANRYKGQFAPPGPAPEGYYWGISKYPHDTSFYELTPVRTNAGTETA